MRAAASSASRTAPTSETVRHEDKRPAGRLRVPSARRGQFARATSTRLSEKDGAWPMSVKAPDETLLTVPSLSWRQ